MSTNSLTRTDQYACQTGPKAPAIVPGRIDKSCADLAPTAAYFCYKTLAEWMHVTSLHRGRLVGVAIEQVMRRARGDNPSKTIRFYLTVTQRDVWGTVHLYRAWFASCEFQSGDHQATLSASEDLCEIIADYLSAQGYSEIVRGLYAIPHSLRLIPADLPHCAQWDEDHQRWLPTRRDA